MTDITPKRPSARVIKLAERAGETIEVTELEPDNGTFIGKTIKPDGRILEYPFVKWWRQAVAVVPATVPALFAYLREARTRNICLIRGAPANLERQRTRRQIAYRQKRGNDGFIDEPSRLIPFDLDKIKMAWRGDPEAAIRDIVEQLGEPFASTSFVWLFSATHGLVRETVVDGDKKWERWTGKISDDTVRVHLFFIADRAVDATGMRRSSEDCKSAGVTGRLGERSCRADQLHQEAALGRPPQPGPARQYPHHRQGQGQERIPRSARQSRARGEVGEGAGSRDCHPRSSRCRSGGAGHWQRRRGGGHLMSAVVDLLTDNRRPMS